MKTADAVFMPTAYDAVPSSIKHENGKAIFP
jgi:hypothetical protein